MIFRPISRMHSLLNIEIQNTPFMLRNENNDIGVGGR